MSVEDDGESAGRSPKKRSLPDVLALILGQWWGLGRSPKAPGTVGSVGAVPLFLLLGQVSEPLYWGTTALLTLVGTWASERCSQLLGDKDPSSVVIDEVAGVLIAMGLVRHQPTVVLVAAWVLFRLLDIKKPWMIDRVQYLQPSGVGIMADDVLAGAVAGALCAGYVAFGGPV